jgi:hypothetical protein
MLFGVLNVGRLCLAQWLRLYIYAAGGRLPQITVIQTGSRKLSGLETVFPTTPLSFWRNLERLRLK